MMTFAKVPKRPFKYEKACKEENLQYKLFVILIE